MIHCRIPMLTHCTGATASSREAAEGEDGANGPVQEKVQPEPRQALRMLPPLHVVSSQHTDVQNKLSGNDDDEFVIQAEAGKQTKRPARGGKPVRPINVVIG